MRALLGTDVQAFAERALPWATLDPIVNNVLATTVATTRAGLLRYDDALWITVVDEISGDVVGAAMHTPPYRLFVCRMSDEAVRSVAEAVARVRPRLPGVAGVAGASAAFAEEWRWLAQAEVDHGMAQRIYSTDSVVPPSGVPGQLRDVEDSDRGLLLSWLADFHREAIPGQPSLSAPAAVDLALSQPGWALWEVDGRPVSLAAARPPAAGVARVGPVYTPPEQRRHGYAAACTAEVSRRALAKGAAYCMLYTDLANPTSNSIYQQMGYRAVGDAQEYAFTY